MEYLPIFVGKTESCRERIENRPAHRQRGDACAKSEMKRSAQLCHRINHTMPMTDECDALIRELFCGRVGGGSSLPAAPAHHDGRPRDDRPERQRHVQFPVHVGGGITIEDGVLISANVQLRPTTTTTTTTRR